MPKPMPLQRRLALQGAEHRPISLEMMFRLFLLIAAVFGLFLAPVGMANGAAIASASVVGSSDHVAHCAGEDPQEDRSSEEMIGCVSACSALPALEAPYTPLAKKETAKAQLPTHQLLLGIYHEGETPPPRITPEI